MKFDLYDAVREHEADQNRDLVRKLSQENPGVQQELLGIIGQADPSVFINKKRGHLQVVSDEKRRAVEQLIGVPIATLYDTGNEGLILPESSSDLSIQTHTQDTKSMSEAEFSIFSALYFSDTEARDMFVGLFMQEKENQGNNFKLDLNNLYEEVFEDEPTNLYSFGTTEKKDPFKIRLQRFVTGERKRVFEYVYSYAKVRRRHGKFGDSFFIRLAKTLGGHIGLRETEVIDFPGKYKKTRVAPQEFQAKKLRSDTPEIVSKAFITAMIQTAKLPENIEWYIGARTEVFIPDEIKKQLTRMEELEVLGGLYNYHEHIESTLAMLIGYYYPELVGKYGVQRGKSVQGALLEKYPSLGDIHVSHSDSLSIKSEQVDRREDDTIILEMNEKVAEYFGFTENRKLRCSPKLIEHIFGLSDEEPVIFDIDGKKAEISAKMFRRVFHREGLPDKAETDNVLPFSNNLK